MGHNVAFAERTGYRRKSKRKAGAGLFSQLDLFMDFSVLQANLTVQAVGSASSSLADLFQDTAIATPAEKFNANIKAIQLLKELDRNNRKLTSEDQKVLLSYSGWGGLAQVFEDYSKPCIWKDRQAVLRSEVTDVEYMALRKSVMTTYFTPAWLVGRLWQAAQHLGFTGGKVLEPAMGTGHFFGLMPDVLQQNSHLTGVEVNPVSAQIAQRLYPKSKITVAGFETVSFPNGYFDLAIGNVPFGDFSVYEPVYNKYNLLIHNHFLLRSLDLVRPGGLAIFITSTGTMQSDKEGGTARKLLAERADLLGAVRLPKGAFSSTGTDVAVDILFLQKRKPLTPATGPAWVNLKDTDIKLSSGESARISEYYTNHPGQLLGTAAVDSRWGKSLILKGDGRDLGKDLDKIIHKLPEGVFQGKESGEIDAYLQRQYMEKRIRHGGYLVDENDVVCYLVDGAMLPVEKSLAVLTRIRGMIKIRDTVRNLLYMQLSNYTDDELKEKRESLNEHYDRFVKCYGLIHEKENMSAFVGDKDHGLLLALEEFNKEKKMYQKSTVFYKRTIYPFQKVEKTATAKEALIVSLQESAKVNLARIAALSGKSEEDVITELKGYIYFDPATRLWKTAEEYLSGYVKEKLDIAREAARSEPCFEENVTALETVQPAALPYNEIDARLGAPWIPVTDISLFACSLLGEDNEAVTVVHMPSIGEWKVSLSIALYADSVGNTKTWGTGRVSAMALVEYALNQKIPEVRDVQWNDVKNKEVYVVNQKETLVARQQLEKIKDHFKLWIWQDLERRQRLAAFYNEQFNNYRLRSFNGSHMQFPGLSADISLREHQKNAVWRILQTKGNTLLGHVVGAGKTFTMQAAGMELKRMGLANKPLYAVPNANFDDFVSMFYAAYPLANLLVLKGEDLPEVTTRQKKGESDAQYLERRELNRAMRFATLNRIVTGEYDGIVLSHELFRRVAISPESENQFIRMQIDDLEMAIRDMKRSEKESKRLVKSLENAKENLEYRIKRDLDAERRDIAVCFEDLGIDALFIDEADIFKNLFFASKMTRVAGVQNTGSQRSMDMFMKVYTLSEQGKSVVFATGTPISNTIAEMYTMQRYLSLKELRRRGLAHFDAWAATFGEVVNSLERSPDGQSWRTVSRFANFINAPELITFFRSFADIQTAEDLNLPKPRLRGNDRIVVESNPGPALLHFIREIIMKRVKAIRDGKVKPWEDNMLSVTSDMRKASLDIRLINPRIRSEKDSKINQLVNHVAKIWEETKEQRSTQMIFCDLSIPKGKSPAEVSTEFDSEDHGNLVVYEEIKKLLITKGIPANEIAFIHDAKNQKQKELLKEKVRQGDIRVLIGSTTKMGVGINIQNKLIALHHLDCPWRPRDIEQREGRILRQGNENQEVMIFVYVTRESADAWLWQTVKAKARFISQAMSGKLIGRTLSDIEQTTLGYAEIEAIATGNPLIVERVKIDSEVDKFLTLKNKWIADRYAIEDELARLPKEISFLEQSLSKYRQDISSRKDTTGDKFKIVLHGWEYTKRQEGQKALDGILENIKGTISDNFAEFDLGSFAGFTLRCTVKDKLFFQEIQLTLNGAYAYEVTQSLQSLEYAVKNAPNTGAEKTLKELAAANKKLMDLRVEKNREFEFEERLKLSMKRQQELIRILQDQEQKAG